MKACREGERDKGVPAYRALKDGTERRAIKRKTGLQDFSEQQKSGRYDEEGDDERRAHGQKGR